MSITLTPATATAQHFAFLVDGGDGAPQRARELVAGGVSGGAFEAGFIDDLLLAVSEVVTNSVQHGNAGEDDLIELVLVFDSACVRIDVCDNGPGFTTGLPAPRSGRRDGMGLPMVELLSDRWGVACSNPTRVWFQLRPDQARAACCEGPTPTAPRLRGLRRGS